MSELFANKNIQKISYIAPLDIAQLFTKDRLHSTINYIFGTFVDMVLEGKNDGYEIEEPIVYNSAHNIFLVEYTFLIKCLSRLVDNKDAFIFHFSINNKDKKNIALLTVSILENYLNLVKMNSKKINCARKNEVTYIESTFINTVISYKQFGTEKEMFLQMRAVPFQFLALDDLLDNELKRLLITCVNGSNFKQMRNVYGSKACYDFWLEKKSEALYFA